MKERVNVVIPAAGEATRLRPLTNNTSKAMVRVNGRPALDYIIEAIEKDFDIEKMVIVDGQLKDISKYVNKISHTKDYEILVETQKSLDGPRDAISKGIKCLDVNSNFLIGDNNVPLLVWLGDTLVFADISECFKGMNDDKSKSFVVTSDVKDKSQFCILTDNGDIIDKPDFDIDGKALIGIYGYASTNEADSLFDSKEYEISSTLLNTSSFNLEHDQWYDIGTLQNYHRTCGALLQDKARAFNNISYNQNKNTITKSLGNYSEHAIETVHSECEWYRNIPSYVKYYIPTVYNISDTSIEMDYVAGTLMSDLLLHDNLPSTTWEYFIDKMFNILLEFHKPLYDYDFNKHFYSKCQDIWIDKTSKRLSKNYINETYREVYDKCLMIGNKIIQESQPVEVMHGDFHLGNMIYNEINDKITVFDPRGSFGNVNTCHGDSLYDYAKLAHDLYWGYSAAVANVEMNKTVKEIFLKKLKKEFSDEMVDLIIGGGYILVATCIPLHSDDPKRQDRLIKIVEDGL